MVNIPNDEIFYFTFIGRWSGGFLLKCVKILKMRVKDFDACVIMVNFAVI